MANITDEPNNEQELMEIIRLLPSATVEQLDNVGFAAEMQEFCMAIGGARREDIHLVSRLINAVNAELKNRGLAIRPQDRK